MLYKLILLDDDAMILQSLHELVQWEEMGFEVTGTFADGTEALQFMENHTVHAIITDICMPDMNGIEFGTLCREKYPDIKILFLSAYREFEYAQSALQLGNVVDYLTKPLNFGVLKERMQYIRNSLMKDAEQNVFSSETEWDERLQFFSNLLCGEIQENNELQTLLKRLEIFLDPQNTVCTLVNFHIQNFSELVRQKHQYTSIQMHHAISNLFPFEAKDGFYSLAVYSYGNLVWIILHKNAEIERSVNDFIEIFSERMKNHLNIEACFKSKQTYHSLFDIIRQANVNGFEQIEEASSIELAQNYIKEHSAETLTLNEVARRVYMSPTYFSSYFKRKTGKNFIEYLTDIRMEHAARLLRETDLIIAKVCEDTGYNHAGNFHDRFKKYYDMTPSEYRKKYRG